MSTKRNLIENAISSIGQKSIRVLEQIFLIPFFITYWGTSYYGEWLTLTIFPSVLAFADMGMGSAAANSFVLKYTGGKLQEASDIFKTGLVIITLTILFILILGLFSIGIAIHFDWFGYSLIPTDQGCYALTCMIISKLSSFYMQLYEAKFRASRKSALGINLQTCHGLLSIGAGLTMLLSGHGVVGFALSQLIVSIVYNIVYAKFAIKALRFNEEVVGVYNRSRGKEIFSKGLGYFLNPMWQTVLFQGTTLVVRIVLGPAAVAVFNTVRTLSRSINQMYGIINSSIFPEIQIEIGAGNITKAKKILMHAMKVTAGIAVIGFLGMLIFGLPIYNWWTKNELNPPYTLWLLLILSTTINAVWWTTAVVFRAMNTPYGLSLAGTLFSMIAIAITYYSSKSLGLIGAGIGTLFFEIAMAAFVLPYSFKLFRVYEKNNNIHIRSVTPH